MRRDAVKSIDKIKKDSIIGEDEAKALSDDIQKLTDSYIKQVDDLLQSKEKVSIFIYLCIFTTAHQSLPS